MTTKVEVYVRDAAKPWHVPYCMYESIVDANVNDLIPALRLYLDRFKLMYSGVARATPPYHWLGAEAEAS